MIDFSSWLEEKKTKESLPDTATSSPVRGQNQDQSGFNGKNDVADYTISDSAGPDSWEKNSPQKRVATVRKIIKQDARYAAVPMPHSKIKEEVVMEISDKLIGKVNKARALQNKPSKTPVANATLQRAVRRAFIKTPKPVNEVIAGVGKTRITPVSMKTSGHTGTKGSPTAAHSMQHAADARRIQLDKMAQREKDRAKSDREQKVRDREAAAAQRKSQDGINS
jgi:hypothetical protein